MTTQGLREQPKRADHQQPKLGTAPSSPLQPRFAPLDFHLFGAMKEFTRDTKLKVTMKSKGL